MVVLAALTTAKRFFALLRTAGRRALRTAGRPGSANGASAFHLWWDPPPGPLVEVSAVVEVLTPPSVRRLYFWALQVGFAEGSEARGVGHTGLQWNTRYPGGTAVNWGGYSAVPGMRGVLPGSESRLAGFAGDLNTLAYRWVAGRPYRLRVSRTLTPSGDPVPGSWRAEVIDLVEGTAVVIRDLYGGGDRLVSPVVWSEVFADCDAPTVRVRWSGLEGVDMRGQTVEPLALRVTYQRVEDGGCSNTSVALDGIGVLQVTGVPRDVAHGTVLRLS